MIGLCRPPWLSAAAVVWWATVPAHAASAPSPSATAPAKAPSLSDADLRAEAEERWNEGRRLYESGQIDTARLKYAQAFAVLNRTNVLWNLAIAEFHSGRYLEALRHFKLFRTRPDAEPADLRKAEEKYLPEAAARTGHVVLQGADGVEVLVDGVAQPGTTPLEDTVDVAPGRHTFLVRYKDLSETHTVDCPAGVVVNVSYGLRPPEGDKLVVAYPPARTYVAGAMGVGALLSLGVGVLWALDSQQKDDDNRVFATSASQKGTPLCQERGSEACTAWQDRLDTQQRSANLSKVFYLAGGLLGAAAAVTYWAWPKPQLERGTTFWVRPNPILGGAMLSVGGTFDAPRRHGVERW